MPRGRTLLLLVALCAGAEAADAQRARVERRGPPEVAAVPGEALTLPFRVTNLDGAPAALPGRAALPQGWRAAGGVGSGELAGGQAELRLLGVVVPASAAAGRHPVRYQAGGAVDSTIVVVPERHALTVEPIEGGSMAIAGRAYAVRFRIANGGNVPERVAVRAEGDQGLRPVADPASVLLQPGAEAVVTARGETDGRAAGNLRHQVTLHAQGSVDTAAGRTMLRVMPRGGARVHRPRLPAEVRVRAADSLAAASIAVSAHGALDRAGRIRLDAEARTGDPAGAPFARRDEYRLRVQGPGFGVRLGDGVYALSRLTEPGRHGMGAAAELARGWVSVAGMASRDRRGEGGGAAAGGIVRLGPPRARVGLAYAVRDSGGSRWAVQAAAEPHPLLRVEAEAAPAGTASEIPRAVHVRGTSRILSYDLLHLRGAPAYRGGRSADQDYAAVTLRPFGNLSLSASERRGLDAVLVDDSVHLLRSFRRAGASWGRHLLVEVRETAGDTAAPGDLRAVYGRLGIPLVRNGWIHPGFEVGEVVVAPAAAPAPYRVFSLHSALSAPGASFWGQVQLREGASPYHRGSREWSGALSADWTVLPRTVLRFSGQGRRVDGGPLQASVDVALERGLVADHRISMRALAVAGPVEGWRPRFYVEYALPLGIPLPARGGDRLVARVVDAATGRGMPDVFVHVAGRVALTDRRGAAAFAGLPEGTHALRVSAGTATELVAEGGLPRSVTVGPGGAARVEVALHRAARLAGTVERVAVDSTVLPMAGVTVLLTGPGGEHRTVTDGDGRFSMTGLWPGWWRVSVDAASLPRHHALAADGRVLLQPGERGESWLRVVEKERPVQMIQGGVLAAPGVQP